MLEDLDRIDEPTVVLIQPCGHNPTGVDPTKEEWDEVIGLLKRKNHLLPFVDMA